MRNKVIASLLSLALIVGFFPITARAEASSLTLGNTPTVIDASGTYTATGTATAPIIINGGLEVTLTVTDLHITVADDFATTADIPTRSAIHIKPGAKVTLQLAGTNSLTAGAGGAGIYVEAAWDTTTGEWIYDPDACAKLTVEGAGVLTATGGDTVGVYGAGAGIGGAGVHPAYTDGGDFGAIVINGGTITANGGDATTTTQSGTKSGAGAGIGGGGIAGGGWTYAGSIRIGGGSITAVGGNTYDKNGLYSGAAGIGSGTPDSNCGSESNITVDITGGTVTATGGACGAGIGGGANGSGAYTTITGGTVTAIGKDDGTSSFGGAGIGGGDTGKANPITIGGTAKVYAYGSASAAGIGGGGGGWKGSTASAITIEGAADVYAAGGTNGAAGIGSGSGGYLNCGTITLNSTGKVIAVAGRGAESIGIGYKFDSSYSKYTVTTGESCGALWMLNAMSSGTSNSVYFEEAPADILGNLVWYTHPMESGVPAAYPAADTVIETTSADDNTWSYSVADGITTLVIKDKNGATISSCSFPMQEGATIGNWAILHVVPLMCTVSFDANTGSGNMAAAVTGAGEYLLPACSFTPPHGKQFAGWARAADGTVIDAASISLLGDTVLYAIWEDIPDSTVTFPGTEDADGDSVPDPETAPAPFGIMLIMDTDGGTWTAPAGFVSQNDGTYALTVTANVDLTDMDVPVKEDYIFLGWLKTTDARNNIILTAQWEEAPSDTDWMYWYWLYMKLRSQEYKIEATATEGGSISPAGVSTVKYGGSLTYTVTPLAGYKTVSVTVDGKDIGAVTAYTFTNVKADHTVSAVFEKLPWENPFSDVTADDLFYEDVRFVSENGLMIGTDLAKGLFSPNDTLDRATVVTILWRLAGAPAVTPDTEFTDLPDDWYTAAMKWAISEGIILGYGDGTCRPLAKLTHEEVIVILHRFAVQNGYTDTATDTDTAHLTYSDWAEDSVRRSLTGNLLAGLKSALSDLTADATRAEIAAYLHVLCVQLKMQ